MLSERCFRSVMALTLGMLSWLVMGTGPASSAVDRAEVERVRAGIRGTTIIVDWHGTWDFGTIQAALDASTNGDTIIVLPSAGAPGGAYVENIVFPARAVTLRSINPEDPAIVAGTVIYGDKAEPVVTFAEGTPPEAALEGFTITNGSGTSRGPYSNCGGGMFLSSSSPRIANNTIADNRAHCGGGLCLTNSSPTIENNTISYNYAEYCGGLCVMGGSPTIRHNTLRGNGSGDGDGGGLYLSDSFATIADNTIADNHTFESGGGLYVEGGAPVIANNTIADNSASHGGGLYLNFSSAMITGNTITGNGAYIEGGGLHADHSIAAIVNNTIRGNTSDGAGGGMLIGAGSPIIANNSITGNSANYWGDGGGLYAIFTSATIVNSTVTGNSAARDGGGLYIYDSALTMVNTLVAFNSSGVYRYWTSTPTLRHNCVYGNTT